jgi:hypothetical protein
MWHVTPIHAQERVLCTVEACSQFFHRNLRRRKCSVREVSTRRKTMEARGRDDAVLECFKGSPEKAVVMTSSHGY